MAKSRVELVVRGSNRRPRYEYVVSLGSFCGPALELRRYGLREASYPFDWVVINVEALVQVLERRFTGFLQWDAMVPHPILPHVVRDSHSCVDFHHDFDHTRDLEVQCDSVLQRYQRRIDRFYASAANRTLFVLYLVSDADYAYLDANFTRLMELLRGLNPGNDLILIANSNQPSVCGGSSVYLVDPDEGDTVARRFLAKNRDLRLHLLFLRYPITRRISNLHRHLRYRLVGLWPRLVRRCRNVLG